MTADTPHLRTWTAVLIGLCGTLVALALPFAPVVAESSTITWPAPGQPVSSSTATVAPYRPAALTASIPCTALRADRNSQPVTVLATSSAGDGLVVLARPGGAELQLRDRRLNLAVPDGPTACRVGVDANSAGVSVVGADGRVAYLADEPVPELFGLRTDLDPAQARGMTVTAHVSSPFATSPAPLKVALIAAQLVAVGLALALLTRGKPRLPRLPRLRWSRLWWVDAGVLAALCGWAVVGPLSVDDGWATMIARNVASAGNPGNYYRWWDAAETPFAFSQQLLAPLTEVSIAPLWLRLPSTVLAAATWFVLSRGVLGYVVPGSATVRIRALAAGFMLVAWLPFNLGTRPEAYVAMWVTVALALALRTRTPAGLGWLALVVGLTIPISPNGLLVVAPIVVFAPRLAAVLRGGGRTRLAADILLLCCVVAVGITIVFADQTWDGLVTATDWHTFFGPSIPWYHEPDRYAYLLEQTQQGGAAKRVPVLLSLALLPLVAMLTLRRRHLDLLDRRVIRLAAVVLVSLLAFALTPSKWSYHFGAAAGVFAAFMAAGVVLMVRRAKGPDTRTVVVGAVGSVLLAFTAALAFDGPNNWWLATLYDVPRVAVPLKPLNNPLFWLGLLAVGIGIFALLRRRRRDRPIARTVAAGPALVAVTACAVALAVLAGSFVLAPFRRQEGSIALANLERVTGDKVCGLADDVEVLLDGDPLKSAGGQWFALPSIAPNSSVAVSVSDGTPVGGDVVFDFGRADGTDLTVQPTWRGVGAADVPVGADRVRIRGVGGAEAPGSGVPRLRPVVGLTEFLAGHGPVMLTWPMAFVFPCVHDIARVSGGVADTPRTVVEAPEPRATEDRRRDLGGTFAELDVYGDLREVPSRLKGHPEIDWGSVWVSDDPAAHDDYQRTVSRAVVPGAGATRGPRPER
ncbi:hypothetical protein DVS77_16810 [Mycolicibacterium moriokaense]|nr:hypothetical protein DVS77_16810 [Mycolicibacterium moriokaense]